MWIVEVQIMPGQWQPLSKGWKNGLKAQTECNLLRRYGREFGWPERIYRAVRIGKPIGYGYGGICLPLQ